MLRSLWTLALLLASLGLVMGGAHVLELPVRMQYEPVLHMRVTSTLYRYFGLIGGPLQVLALLVSAVLAWQLRGRRAFRSTLFGTLGLLLSLVLWFLLVQPVNTAWAEAIRAGTDEAVAAYQRLGNRWEYGHVAAFAAWLAGWILLLNGVIAEAAPDTD